MPLGKPLGRVIVDLDLRYAVYRERDDRHGPGNDDLPPLESKPADSVQRRVEKAAFQVLCFGSEIPQPLFIHQRDVRRDHNHGQHPCQGDPESDKDPEDLHRRDGREGKRRKTGDGCQRGKNVRTVQFMEDV